MGITNQDPAWENLEGNSCSTRRRGKRKFNKGSDWWKFSIWNRVMGSQPIRIQLGKILWENLVGKSCEKFLWENLAGKSCEKILQEILREILAGQGGGEKANLRKALIGGNLAFGIGWWGANQSGSNLEKSCGKILWENLAGNSCGKILQENLAGKSWWAVQVWVNVPYHIRSCWPLIMHHPGQGKALRTLVSTFPLKNYTQADLPKTHRAPSPW